MTDADVRQGRGRWTPHTNMQTPAGAAADAYPNERSDRPNLEPNEMNGPGREEYLGWVDRSDLVTTGPGGLHERARATAGQVGVGIYAFLLCVLVLVLAGLIGVGVHQPWLFPSLGPTLMMFFEQPASASSRPRYALIGHAVGILAGLVMLEVFGLRHHPSSVQEGLTGARVAAAALSLGLTTLVLSLLRSPHPPAGATTLIVSLGILTTSTQLATMALAVVFVVVVGLLLNRLLGVRQPWW